METCDKSTKIQPKHIDSIEVYFTNYLAEGILYVLSFNATFLHLNETFNCYDEIFLAKVMYNRWLLNFSLT